MGSASVPLAGFKGLRRDLLVALRKQQPLTAKELGTRFGLTANAFRRHLTSRARRAHRLEGLLVTATRGRAAQISRR